MQCWRVSMFKLLRSKNKDQKHLSSWLRKHFSNPPSDLRLLDTCSAIWWQVRSVPTHGPARHRLMRGGGKQHVSSICIRYDVYCTERGSGFSGKHAWWQSCWNVSSVSETIIQNVTEVWHLKAAYVFEFAQRAFCGAGFSSRVNSRKQHKRAAGGSKVQNGLLFCPKLDELTTSVTSHQLLRWTETHTGVTHSTVCVTRGNWRSLLLWTSTSSGTRSWVLERAWGPIGCVCQQRVMFQHASPSLSSVKLASLLCVPAHPGWGVGSEDIRDGHQSTVSLPYLPGSPAQHRRPGAGVRTSTITASVNSFFS